MKKSHGFKKYRKRRKNPKRQFGLGALVGAVLGGLFLIIPYVSEEIGERITAFLFGAYFFNLGWLLLLLVAVLVLGFGYMFGYRWVLGIVFGFVCAVLVGFFIEGFLMT